MRKIVYLPIDERPCNYNYIINNFGNIEGLNLLTPDLNIMGYKKMPANIKELTNFVNKNCDDETSLIISFDLFNYGGLCPSRLHYFNENDIQHGMNLLRDLKVKFPKLKIYGFSSVMRNPKYSSNDEEPDYYEHFGREIHRKSYLEDKVNFVKLNNSEINELKNISIPKHVINDYEKRRETNLNVNIKILELINENILDLLVIPQDDSAEFGYTRKDQEKLLKFINNFDESKKSLIHIYPGLDDVGLALVSKAILDIDKNKINVNVKFSTEKGREIIPNYEDREMHKTLDLHLKLFNANQVEYVDSEYVIFINSAIEKTFESWEQENDGEIKEHHIEFVKEISKSISEGKKVIIVDSAFTNGSDKAFVHELDNNNLLSKVETYMAWNTNANSLGTALATGFSKVERKIKIKNIAYHLIEDYAYQSIVRMDVNENVLNQFEGATYFSLKNWTNEIIKIEEKKVNEIIKDLNFFSENVIEKMNIWHPWNRMFEIGIELEIK